MLKTQKRIIIILGKKRLEERLKRVEEELECKEGQQNYKKRIFEEEMRKNKEMKGQKPRGQ